MPLVRVDVGEDVGEGGGGGGGGCAAAPAGPGGGALALALLAGALLALGAVRRRRLG